MNDMMLPVSPPETNVRSAGMIGSLRNCTLMLLATPYVVMTVPNMMVAIQNLFVMKISARYTNPKPTKLMRNMYFCSNHIWLTNFVSWPATLCIILVVLSICASSAYSGSLHMPHCRKMTSAEVSSMNTTV